MKLREDKARVYAILICVALGFFILFLDLFLSKVNRPKIEGTALEEYGASWNVNLNNVTYPEVNFPTLIKEASIGDTLILTKQLPETLENDTLLFFRASHQNVKGYINDQKVYSFGWGEQRIFGKSPACTWVIIPISKKQAGDTITIELTGAYNKYAKRINQFYIGDRSAILYYIVINQLGSIIACFVLVIFGFCMIIIAISLRNRKITASLFRLGILSLLVGIWSVCVTNVIQVLYANVFALLNIEFFIFTLLLPITLWYLISFEYYKNQRIMKALFWTSVVLFIVIEILQLMNVADYMETIIASHILIGISLCYVAITGVRDLFRNNAPSEVKILSFSVVIFLLFLGIDLVRFYTKINYDEGFFTRIGMLAFIVMWAVDIIRNMSKLLIKTTQTQLLEALAYEDQMTGLKNRTAFEEKLREYREADKIEDAYIFAFDMNNLKNINDNFGHAKGDQAIISIANIIKLEFGLIGTCYRIGGDEICVILEDASKITEEMIEEKMNLVNKAVKVSCRELKLNFSVASGYSKISNYENHNIDYAYREADRRMYERKQKMKNTVNTENFEL